MKMDKAVITVSCKKNRHLFSVLAGICQRECWGASVLVLL